MMRVRSDIVQVYKTLHTWTGIVAGMALFIAFFAGALTMFEQPLARWLQPPAADLAALQGDSADRAIQHVLQTHPEAASRLFLHLPGGGYPGAPLTWMDGSGQAWQATLGDAGELDAAPAYRSDFADFIDRLHQTAGIPGEVGHEELGVLVMGVVSVLYCLALISGLIVLLPTLAQDFLALRRRSSNKRFWLDAHNVVGVSSFPFHLVIALTAIVFAFHDPFYGGLQQLVYGDRPLFERPALTPIDDQRPEKLLPVEDLLQRAAAVAPGFQVQALEFINLDKPHAMLRMAGIGEGQIVRGPHYGYLILQPYSGAVVNSGMVPGQMDTWNAVVASFFALHFGNYGGDPLRWLYFLLGAGGAFLFFSGNLLWLESRRRRQRNSGPVPAQRRDCYWLAAATMGVCLGSMIGVAASLVSAKWLYGLVADLNAWHSGIYYLVFFASIAIALWQGASRAAVQLLLVLAVLCLTIPLSGVVAMLADGPGWLSDRPASWAVDVTALALALAFAGSARLAYRRRWQGPRDSIWSAYCELEPRSAITTAVTQPQDS